MPEYVRELLRRPPIGWWDVLDILIVSFLIYEFLKLIRGTRAMQMAAGSLLIVGLFYVSRLAPLQTVNWMIRNMLAFVAFAAIVIFQSDIRRALAHFGQAPFFRYLNRQQAADEINEALDRHIEARAQEAEAAQGNPTPTPIEASYTLASGSAGLEPKY